MKRINKKELEKINKNNLKIKNITDAVEFLKNSIDLNQENFILIGLNSKSKPIFTKILFKGGVSFCLIDEILIYRHLFINNCKRFILGHNHPSGDLTPSGDDLSINKKFKKQCKILKISMIDNIIFNENNYISINEFN